MARWTRAAAALALVTGVLVAAQVLFPSAAYATSSHMTTIGAGYDASSCAIRGGKAYCWGANASGELGNDSTISSDTPVPVYTGGALSGLTLTQIAVGSDFACALSGAGAVYCWGVNGSGQLGNNSITTSSVPVAVTTSGVLSGLTLTQVDAGASFACVLSSAGNAYCWGQGSNGTLGNGTTTSAQETPVEVSQGSIPGGDTLTEITTGTNWACALASNSAAYCWGKGSSGQLGNGGTSTETTPVAVSTSGVLNGVTLTQINGSLGGNTTCALSSAGAVYCWGLAGSGQLGNGTPSGNQDTPVAVTTSGTPLSGVTVTQVTGGKDQECALGSNGAAYCWGGNTHGDLGDNSASQSDTAVAVTTSGVLSGVTLTQITAGGYFTCALDSNGAVYCWGLNGAGEAGNPDTGISSLVPETVAPPQANTVAAGTSHSCTILGGRAYCWGDNTDGELGNDTSISSSVPVAANTGGVLSGVTLTQITAGDTFTCALSAAGAAYCWGLGTSGQLGNGATATSSLPVAVSTSGVLSGVTLTQITAGNTSVCALSAAGAAYCWGAGGSGQLGNGATTSSQDTPVAVTTGGSSAISSSTVLSQITAGNADACAVSTAGAAYCWGAGGSGQLGNGATTATQDIAVAVTTGGSSAISSSTVLAQITAGNAGACALSTAGAAYCWGAGSDGQLGNNSTTSSQDLAVAVTTSGALSGVPLIQIDAGSSFTCALGSTGNDYCWGLNSSGQLGNPATAENSEVPVAVTSEATMIASGYDHACLLRNGKARCWGDDTYGELGNNTTTTTAQSTPVAVYTAGVLSGVTLIQVTTGEDFTCALSSAGNAYCWGNNDSQSGDLTALGNNTTSSSDVPVEVSGGYTFSQISAGVDFACGLTTAGVAYCWGNNHDGQLGDNGTGIGETPQAVTTGSSSAISSGTVLTQITAGTIGVCVLSAAGAAYCWGEGGSGQLGNGSTTSSQDTAVAVTTGGSSAIASGTVLAQITAGNADVCALSAAGAAYCWGAGGSGQLGNNSTTATQDTAVAVTTSGVLSGVTLTQITAGTSFACALGAGAAYCWGLGTGDQLGNGGTSSSSTAVAVSQGSMPTGTTLFQIASGQLATCAQDTTEAFYCWGGNGNGQLGNASTTSSDVPVTVSGIVPGSPTSVAAFPAAASAVVYWAAPSSLGTGTLTGYLATASPGGATCSTTTAVTCTITGLSNGTTYTITVITETTDGNSGNSTAATVTPWPPAASITAGSAASCTLYSGKAYCWGDDTYGELGNNTTSSTAQLTPVAVYTGGALSGVTLTQISSGTDFSCALSAAGAVYCWGLGTSGQLGDSSSSTSDAPVAVTTSGVLSGVTVVQITVGGTSACALSAAGAAYCWGDDTYGELGNNTTTSTPQNTPVAVYTSGVLSGVTLAQVTAGTTSACALSAAGAVYCWGLGTSGQLGNGGTTSSDAAVAVTTSGVLSGVTVVQIAVGGTSACALSAAGAAYCWGAGGSGQLGNGTTTTTQDTAVAVTTSGVLSGVTLTQITAGTSFACALGAGTAYCWGANGTGQVGNDSTTQQTTAVLVGPQAPTSVSGIAGNTTAAMSWTAPVYLNNGTLTSYTATASPGSETCTSSSAASCTITGLTDGITYTITVITTASTGTSAPSSSASVDPIGLDMTTPTSLTWGTTETGLNQSIVDGASGDQQMTVGDSSGTTGWHITLTATTLTTGAYTLPNTAAMDFTGSTGSLASTSPSTACVGSCTLPTNTTTYPVAITTAASGPGTYTIYDTSASTGVGVVTIGGSGATNPIGWWINVPASAYAGSYTTTVTLNLVSGP
jgi:alpha-tubulin suppressor-like RCC1 family protein